MIIKGVITQDFHIVILKENSFPIIFPNKHDYNHGLPKKKVWTYIANTFWHFPDPPPKFFLN